MSRIVVLVTLLALGGAGCRRQRAAVVDFGAAVAPGALTCAGLQGCVDACAAAAASSCAEGCVRRLGAAARPYFDALQACVVPACADIDAGSAPCREPSTFACKMCVLQRCASLASACMLH